MNGEALPGGEWYNPYGDPTLTFDEAYAVLRVRRAILTKRRHEAELVSTRDRQLTKEAKQRR